MDIFYYFVNCKLSQNFLFYKYKSVLEREKKINNASDIKIIKYIFQYNYYYCTKTFKI